MAGNPLIGGDDLENRIGRNLLGRWNGVIQAVDHGGSGVSSSFLDLDDGTSVQHGQLRTETFFITPVVFIRPAWKLTPATRLLKRT